MGFLNRNTEFIVGVVDESGTPEGLAYVQQRRPVRHWYRVPGQHEEAWRADVQMAECGRLSSGTEIEE